MQAATEVNRSHLGEVARVFLKLGFLGFGGPAVHIAMMEEELVRKRQWMTQEHFLDLIGATNLIPGPNSTEMALHCGHERAGWRGLLLAGACFILPAVFLTGLLAWAYKAYGMLPQVAPFIYGIKPAIIGIILAMMIRLGRKALKTIELGIIGLACLILAVLQINDIYILFGAGLLGILIHLAKQKSQVLPAFLPLLLLNEIRFNAPNWRIFWIFLKIGSILYGSGYVLFGFLNSELVQTGMLSKHVLVDAIAAGQFTPGPVFSSATFVGWQIGGIQGAAAATLGIFLPSFVFVGFLNPLVKYLRKSKIMSVFLDTVNIASIALIVAICADLGRDSIFDWRTVLLAIAGFGISFQFPKINSAFVVLGGAAAGYLMYLI